MPASQLKQLKASLREQGLVGPQKSKKQKKQGISAAQRKQREAALNSIRDAFKPFDVKVASRPNKRDVTTPQTMKTAGKGPAQVYGRPGVTKSQGEELRRKSLLLELQRRNKVGGITDRRIGEEDPNMTPEEKMQQRFAREQERKSKKHALFDLEMEEAEEEDLLTHGGRALGFDEDDFDAGSLVDGSDDEDDNAGGLLKRKREAAEEMLAAVEAEPERKKSKKEVMKEIIAKSKLHKYERQQAKEDDEEAREALDKGIGDLRAALFGFQSSLEKRKAALAAATASTDGSNGQQEKHIGGVDPGRAALMEAKLDPDKDYDIQIKKLAQDTRARVTDRTKTEEELTAAAAEKQKALEESRLRRMKGEEDEESDEEIDSRDVGPDGEVYQVGVDDAEAFGLKSHVMERPPGFEDEDEFIIDEDLVASGSEIDEEALDAESISDSSEDEMLKDGDEDAETPNVSSTGANQVAVSTSRVTSCPETYDDIVGLLEREKAESANTLIRKVRLKYDAALSSSNREKLEAFATALVVYLGRRPNESSPPGLETFEAIARHLQSMSRTSPDAIGKAFRLHLEQMHQQQTMEAGDLMVLTAIGTIYPTSDHFHQVVTPAMTLIARWLGLTRPSSAKEFATGAYLTTLALKYQSFSRRYVPEVVRFIAFALQANPPDSVRKTLYSNVRTLANLWSNHSAFIEVVEPLMAPLQAAKQAKLSNHLQLLLNQSQSKRRPLALHNHRPLPIKSLVPKFEESFNPDRHYDPDRQRADTARLKKEYKREKKGAIRELRKDANFLAREQLREKKEKDRAYEEKYRRLVAEIQGEEGREAKEYEREKRRRKRGY
ncbi:uncharacterized protein PV09_01865 [Verruconis gallopava]|uniref:Nop14-like protein n=1 Tax=Verruconis gallopava TaxID=253628 RepID=A0A0D2AN82_9PEZI|nr:uncharacterized protein PV09_01865 [Verruconis gallopava]KIW07965.1 hypothetical protein PV09_01865 [Verruconis gallopava]